MPREDLEKAWLDRPRLGRTGRHDELVNLAAYLMADQSEYITGEVICIDGGKWRGGAGQFTAVGDPMTDDDWEAMKPKKKEG